MAFTTTRAERADRSRLVQAFLAAATVTTIGIASLSLPAIAQGLVALGSGGTFAQLYAKLTHMTAKTAWPTFIAAVRALSGGVTSDDPFAARAAAHAALAALAPHSHRLLPTKGAS